MNEAPREIYLQIDDDSAEYCFDELAEVTWCKHKINDADIKYHHDDKYQKAIAALKKVIDGITNDAPLSDTWWRSETETMADYLQNTLKELGAMD